MDDHCLQQIIQRYEKANFTVNRRLNAMIRDLMPEGLTVDQFGTIRYLRGAGVCTSSELADIFCVGKSSITAIISRLFDKQLIERIPDEKDRRVTLLRLTEEGERVSDLVEKEIEKMIACFMNHFSLEECMAFINTFEKLAEVMTEQAKETDRS
ncbi:MarR family transcriptional regulator [Paenibacillus sp. NEAU-GSW1]|nr:MarR family transcriptional regulator [Paenibacillus sp. NEAU-GSW1]